MKKKNVVEIRQAFLDFFSDKGHKVIESSSLLPEKDPSLLFTNAGMNQFKNIFLGLDKPKDCRVVTAQRCVRVGGKHNDLENVGYTNYHLTFFEMLGNFSFGDYFKDDAITFAWELLTHSRWFNLSKEKILVTVHESDKESYSIWRNKIGILDERIICVANKRIGDSYFSENFWQMGDIGPCGPCSEIFYHCNGDILTSKMKSVDDTNINNQYVEIWNLVFMEFNRQFNGALLPLPMLSVDTGMGLERITSVLQSVNNNYDIDLFYHLMTGIVKIIGLVIDFRSQSLRVIADHIRTCSFLISDGVSPSNAGHGYVLRRIIRRAIRHGKMLGVHGMFFHKLVNPLIDVMGNFNNRLVQYKSRIIDILYNEEKKFSFILEKGLEILKKELLELHSGDFLKGEKVFHLYSTYGLPLQFTKDVCLRFNVTLDEVGFNRLMLRHKQDARKYSTFSIDINQLLLMNYHTKFIGYESLSSNSKIVALFKDNIALESLSQDDLGVVVLNETPFYGESGGQVGDCGEFRTEFVHFEVIETKKYGQVIGHLGRVVSGILSVGNYVTANVNQEHRKCVSLHHSAIHLLNSALVNVLGEHVIQRGSFVSNRYLRFDFSHHMSMSYDQICLVEDIVNQQIRNNLLIISENLPMNIARNRGAKVIFGKQYNDVVRVLSIGNFSVELCGGTHAVRTSDLGLFIIRSESGVASGIRRIEAVCSMEALLLFREQKNLIQRIEHTVHSKKKNLVDKVGMLYQRVKDLERELEKHRKSRIIEEQKRLRDKVRHIGNSKLIVSQVYDFNLKMLRVLVNDIKEKLISGIVVVFCIDSNQMLYLVAGVTKDLVCYVNAKEIVNYVINQVGGSGGGRLNLAQCCGGDVKLLPDIIDKLDMFLIKKIEHCI